MKRIKTFSLLATICVLSPAVACTSRFDEGASQANSSVQAPRTETIQQAQTPAAVPESPRPSTKTETMSVEGEEMEVSLKLYNEVSGVFTTYFPAADFVVESGGSGEGTGARFYFGAGGTKNEVVYVALFFPAEATSLEQIQELVSQDGGLLQSNQWQVVERTTAVPYSWAKEKISFEDQTSSEPIMGEVYVGEANGKAFYVITHYPLEYAEGFAPRADIILRNLQVTAN